MNYIKQFKEIYEELGDIKLTPNNRILTSISILQEMGKDSRTPDYERSQDKKIFNKEIVIKDPNSPASQEQLKLLKSLGYTGTDKINKIEASVLISSLIGK